MLRRPLLYMLLSMLLLLAACIDDDSAGDAPPTPDLASDPPAVMTATPEPTVNLDPAPASEATPEPPGPTPTAATFTDDNELRLDGMICCGGHGTIDGESYLFVMTFGGGELHGHGVLHLLRAHDDGTIEARGLIETPMPLSLDTLTGRSRIGQAGDALYVPVPGHAEGALWVVDVSDPAIPQELAVVGLDHLPLSVSVSGNLAAVVVREFSGPALFFDISDPESPQLLSEHEHALTSLPPDVAFADSHLYVVDFRGVTIINASAPDTPHEAGTHPNPEWDGPPGPGESGAPVEFLDGLARPDSFLDMALAGDYLYLAASDGGLRAVDISDPSNPYETGQLDIPGRAVKVTADGERAYVLGVDVEDGSPPFIYNVHIVDLAPDGQPRLVDTIDGLDSMSPYHALIHGADRLFLLDHQLVRGIELPLIDRPETAATPVPAGEPPDAEVTPGAAEGEAILARFQELQGEVDFELAMPTELHGLTLMGNSPILSGPPNAPGITADYADHTTTDPFRTIGFMQRAGGIGLAPERPDDETEAVTIMGVETTLYLETRDDGTTVYRVRWDVDGVHYDLGAMNVDRDTVLAFANSITPLSQIDPAMLSSQ